MNKKEIDKNNLKKIHGGSNDFVWGRYGIALGAYTKCSVNSLSFANPLCTAKGIYAGIKG